MENAKKIAILALLLGGLVTLTAFVAMAGNFDKAESPASVAGEWSGFSLDTKQVLIGNDTSKFPFNTQGQVPSNENNFAFVQLAAKNQQKSANTNLNPYYFDLLLSDGQMKSVAAAQSASGNHWPTTVEAGATTEVWLVYECPKNVTAAKLQCKQPSSVDKPVVLIQVPQATMILVVNNDSHVINYYNNTTYYNNTSKDEKPPVPCNNPKPWPSRIDMIQAPTSMVAGQTYTFKCQMYVQNYDEHCKLTPWWYAVNTKITWTFTNDNGVSVTKDSTTSNPNGIATVEFPCYMAGHWTVVARWAGSANYVETEQRASVSATGNTVYWNGFWVTVEKWYKTADMNKYPPEFQTYVVDPVFVKLRVKNAQPTINTNMYPFYNLYVTDTDGNAYQGVSGRVSGTTNWFADGLAPGAETTAWVCFTVPNNQELTINGMYGLVYDNSNWGAYNGFTGYSPSGQVNFPLTAESPA